MSATPAAPVREKSTGKEPQVKPEASLRSGLRLTSRSPRGPGFLAPVTSRFVYAKLDTSVGVSGPHDFSVRADADRLRHQLVHRIPHTTSVTTRPPLFNRARDGWRMHLIWAGVNLILKIRMRPLRHIGTTGKSRMARMARMREISLTPRTADTTSTPATALARSASVFGR